VWSVVFFFFQAEDAIRVFQVTGVQTCALPTSCGSGGVGEHPPEPHAVTVPVVQGPRDELPRPGGGHGAVAGQLGRLITPGEQAEIGRASCRERGPTTMGEVAVKQEKVSRITQW